MSLPHSVSSQGLLYPVEETISPVAKWGTFVEAELPGKPVALLGASALLVGLVAAAGWVVLFQGVIFGLFGPILTALAIGLGFVYLKWRAQPRLLLRESGLVLTVWGKPVPIDYSDVDLLWYRYDALSIDLTDNRNYTIPLRLFTQAEHIELVYTLRVALDGRFMGYF